MGRKAKELLVSAFCAILPVACFCGAITSTIAWYAYSSTAVVSYHGTSISISNLLQIGLKTDIDMSAYGLKTDGGVAWADPGTGLVPDQVAYYLKESGYAYEKLTPLTSGQYAEGEDLHLTSAPAYGIVYNDNPGEKTSYAVLPLAFRTYKKSGYYLPNENVWMTDASILCKEHEDLRRGVRLHFNDGSEQFIVNSSMVEKGVTKLAGLQDLNSDGYYDAYTNGKEIVYGHYTGEVTYTHSDVPTGLDDINETGQTEETTFCSKHGAPRDIITSYSGLTFTTAEYETLKSIAPEKDETGAFINGKPVCTTGEDGIGYVDMTMWIEGWDHSVYDNAAGYQFLMNLTFIVNSN